MNKNIIPGAIQDLLVRVDEQGMVSLVSGRETIGLHPKEWKGKEDGQEIKVFVYYNEDRELEGSTRLPSIQVGEIGQFEVITANQLGAFIDIGTKRDILIPKREQRTELMKGRRVLVMLGVDEENQRLFGTTRFFNHLDKNPTLERGALVNCLVVEKFEAGRKVVVEGKYSGFLFNQEIMARITEGETIKCYVRKIEGKDVVVSMQKEGAALIDDATDRLLEYVKNNGGYVRLNDDSDPEEIKIRLRMSKKTFKKAAGVLYKQGLVDLTKFGIKLLKEGQEQKPRDLSNWNKEESGSSHENKPRAARLPQRNTRDSEFMWKEHGGSDRFKEKKVESTDSRDQKDRPKYTARKRSDNPHEQNRSFQKGEAKGRPQRKSKDSSSNTSRSSRPSGKSRGPRR